MRRAMSVLLFVVVFSAGVGLVVQSSLRGQGAAVLSTPAAASKSENPFDDASPPAAKPLGPAPSGPRPAASTSGPNPFEPASNRPATRSGPPAGYAGPPGPYAGAMSGMRSGDPEVWQAREELSKLLPKYGHTTDEKERAKIKEGLSKVLAKLFDLQQKERESEIADIEGRVKRLREMLDKRNKARESIITNRLEQIVREAEGLGWVEPDPAGPPGMMMGMPGTSSMYPGMPSGGRSGVGVMGAYGGAGMGYSAGMGPYAEPRKAASDAAKPAAPITFKKKRAGGPGPKPSTP